MTETRSHATNLQQIIVLITGLLYSLIGVVFFLSPILLMRFVSVNANTEWAAQIRYDDFLAFLYLVARLLSGLLFFTGVSMVLPLYDPIRYRELLYFNGIFFPVFASLFFFKKVVEYGMNELLSVAIFFALISMLNAFGLFITKAIRRK